MSVTDTQNMPRATGGTDTSLSAAIKRHPLAAYFIISFAATWLLFTPIVLSKHGVGQLDLPDAAAFALFLLSTYCGPFLAAGLITRLVDGREGLRNWFRRMIQWRVGIPWYLLVLLGYPIVVGVPIILSLGSQTLSAALRNLPSFAVGYLSAIPTGFLLPTLGEEAGWRGFALPRLQQTRGPLLGSLILGSLHALWHLPAYFVSGSIIKGGFNPVAFAGNSLAIIALTFIWTWLYNHAGGSIFFATFVHATSNAMSLALPAALNITSPDPWAGGEIFAVAALIVILLTRGQLGYAAKETTQ